MITAGIKKYKSLIKKKKKKHDKIVFLAETMLNTTKFSISKDLIDSDFSHDEFVYMEEYDDMKEEIKNSNDKYILHFLY